MNGIRPFALLGPGDAIREELAFHGWTVEELGERLGVDAPEVSQLLDNRLPVVPDLARRLGDLFGQSPQFWLNAEARYREGLGLMERRQKR